MIQTSVAFVHTVHTIHTIHTIHNRVIDISRATNFCVFVYNVYTDNAIGVE
jgi:hypothetical protein